METEINGIIIDGKVYQAVDKGSRHCFDCDLYDKCNVLFADVCNMFSAGEKAKLFRHSQQLTDKLNNQWKKNCKTKYGLSSPKSLRRE